MIRTVGIVRFPVPLKLGRDMGGTWALLELSDAKLFRVKIIENLVVISEPWSICLQNASMSTPSVTVNLLILGGTLVTRPM